MKLGAIHRPAPASVAHLSQRASLSLMQPPPRVDWFAKCPADGDALGNQTYGCCVEAADYRIIQIRRANVSGDQWKPTLDMVLGRYSKQTGFDPVTGQPDLGTDTAADMADWSANGIRVNDQDLDVSLWISIDPTNEEHARIAVAHFGPLAETWRLPMAAQDLANWGKAPGTSTDWTTLWGDHRTARVGYDGAETVSRTYGVDVQVHPDFRRAFGIALDAGASQEWCDTTGLTPAGMDWAGLQGDMAKLAG